MIWSESYVCVLFMYSDEGNICIVLTYPPLLPPVFKNIPGFLKGQVEKSSIRIKVDPTTSLSRARTHQEIDELEERLSEHESRVQQMNTSLETLNKRHLELTELRHVLKETNSFFNQVRSF